MKFNIPLNTTDIIVLLILLVVFAFGVKILISFFKTPVAPKKKTLVEGQEEKAEEA